MKRRARQTEKARLEKIAANYSSMDRTGAEFRANEYAVQVCLPYCKGPDVLVMGAGVGVWVDPLIKKHGAVHVVDAVSEHLNRLAKEFGSRVHCYCSLFEALEPEREFDSIVLGHVLEHVWRPIEVLRRASGWLKPKGQLVVLVPNASSLHRHVGVRMGILSQITSLSESDRLLGHRRVYTDKSLRHDIEKAGLRIVNSGGIFLKPLSNAQMDILSSDTTEAFLTLGEAFPDIACIIYAVCRSAA